MNNNSPAGVAIQSPAKVMNARVKQNDDRPPELGRVGGIARRLEPNTEDLRRTWKLLSAGLREDECLELRTFPTYSQSNWHPQVAYVFEEKFFLRLIREACDGGVSAYIGINPRQRLRYDQAPSRWEPAVKRASNKNHVTRRRFIFLDCDPQRAAEFSKHNASDDEKRCLREALPEIKKRIGATFVHANSGNGEYLLVPIDLQNNKEVNKRYKAWFKQELQARYNNKHIKIDSCFDVARMMKIIGVPAYGKLEAPGRPTRMSHWVEILDDLEPCRALQQQILNFEQEEDRKGTLGNPPSVGSDEFPEEWFDEGPLPREKLDKARQQDPRITALLNGSNRSQRSGQAESKRSEGAGCPVKWA